jgi:hypothetical protein
MRGWMGVWFDVHILFYWSFVLLVLVLFAVCLAFCFIVFFCLVGYLAGRLINLLTE